MFPKVLVLAVILVAGEMSVEARTITRSGVTGNVNLVEVDAKGTIYGKCSYVRDAQEIMIMFEETDGVLTARATNPTILDPVSEARQCREAAASPARVEPGFRSALDGHEIDESPASLEMRLIDLQNKIASNEKYISELAPRIIPFFPIPIPTSGTKDLLVTLNNHEDNENNKRFTFHVPDKGFSSTSLGLPFAFPFMHGR